MLCVDGPEKAVDQLHVRISSINGETYLVQEANGILCLHLQKRYLFSATDIGAFETTMKLRFPLLSFASDQIAAIDSLEEGRELKLSLSGKSYIINREEGKLNIYQKRRPKNPL